MPTAFAVEAPARATATLDIYEYAVSGNTVLGEATIGEAVEPFMGPGRTTDDVDQARAALEAAYKDRGYKTVAVTIPRQTGQDGVIRLEVVESRVRLLTVTGSEYHSIDRIAAEAPSLAEGQVPDFNAVQKDLVALNQQADRKVTPALKPGPRPGSLDVVLSVEDDLPVHGSVEVTNRRSQNTSSLRSTASLSYGNLWQRGHTVSLTYQTAPESMENSKVWFGSYLVRFPRSPFSLMFTAIKSDSEVAAVGGTNVVGKGESYGVRGFLSLASSANTYRSLTFGLDYKHNNTTITDKDGQILTTPVSYYPVTLGFNAGIASESNDRYDGSVTATFASPYSGDDAAEFDDNRLYAATTMFHLRSDVSTLQSLPANAELFVRTGGQWTDEGLVTNEQFSAGGADTVRGYLESEALGDVAATFTTELRAPSLAGTLAFGSAKPLFDQFQPYLFVDAARLHLLDAGVEQDATLTLASAGVGINFRSLAVVDGALDFATTLHDGPATDKGDSRVLFRLKGTF